MSQRPIVDSDFTEHPLGGIQDPLAALSPPSRTPSARRSGPPAAAPSWPTE